jgi:hypothetical protein
VPGSRATTSLNSSDPQYDFVFDLHHQNGLLLRIFLVDMMHQCSECPAIAAEVFSG